MPILSSPEANPIPPWPMAATVHSRICSTKFPVGRFTIGQSVLWIDFLLDRVSSGEISYWTECPVVRFPIGQSVQWGDFLLDRVSSGEISYWTECAVDRIPIGQSV